MANIAKLEVSTVTRDGGGNARISFRNVYESDLDGSAGNEDVRFTAATPYGSLELTVADESLIPENWLTEKTNEHYGWKFYDGKAYMLVCDQGDKPSFDGCAFATVGLCHSVTDMGHTKEMNIGAAYHGSDMWQECERIGTRTFTGKMGIDNPQASVQFKPTKFYWILFFDADEMTLEEALAKARV